jgi:hypothetical protein
MQDDAEPPSCLRPPFFLIGQDSRGNWVVREQNGMRGGLFIDRNEALRYIRFENGNRPHAFVTVSGIFELDMTRTSAAPAPRLGVDVQHERRVA